MTSPAGAFYAAQDADSGGVEGRYYLFHYDELLTLLGDEKGRAFNAYYGITPQGTSKGAAPPTACTRAAPKALSTTCCRPCALTAGSGTPFIWTIKS